MAHAYSQAPPAYVAITAPESPVWDAPPRYAVNNVEGFENVPLGDISPGGNEQGIRLPKYSVLDPTAAWARKRKVLVVASVGGILFTFLLAFVVCGLFVARAKADAKVPGEVDSFPPVSSPTAAIDD